MHSLVKEKNRIDIFTESGCIRFRPRFVIRPHAAMLECDVVV